MNIIFNIFEGISMDRSCLKNCVLQIRRQKLGVGVVLRKGCKVEEDRGLYRQGGSWTGRMNLLCVTLVCSMCEAIRRKDGRRSSITVAW